LQQHAPGGHDADEATPPAADGPESREARQHTREDGRVLADLAEIDERLREREAGWKGLVQRLDGLRREIAVLRAQVQRSRSFATRGGQREDDGHQGEKPSPAPDRHEARSARLMQEFETALRETEARRVALHAEMDGLRRRRQALLASLSASIADVYQSLADTGHVPAVAVVANGVCSGCGSPIPASVAEALSQDAVTACARCERLLRPFEGGQ
jgi:hypothetical protein